MYQAGQLTFSMSTGSLRFAQNGPPARPLELGPKLQGPLPGVLLSRSQGGVEVVGQFCAAKKVFLFFFSKDEA